LAVAASTSGTAGPAVSVVSNEKGSAGVVGRAASAATAGMLLSDDKAVYGTELVAFTAGCRFGFVFIPESIFATIRHAIIVKIVRARAFMIQPFGFFIGY
jgi:hypothetical protein